MNNSSITSVTRADCLSKLHVESRNVFILATCRDYRRPIDAALHYDYAAEQLLQFANCFRYGGFDHESGKSLLVKHEHIGKAEQWSKFSI